MTILWKIAAPGLVFGGSSVLLLEESSYGLAYYVEIGDRLHEGRAERVTRDGPRTVLRLHVPATAQYNSGTNHADRFAVLLSHMAAPSVLAVYPCDLVEVTSDDDTHYEPESGDKVR